MKIPKPIKKQEIICEMLRLHMLTYFHFRRGQEHRLRNIHQQQRMKLMIVLLNYGKLPATKIALIGCDSSDAH